MAMLKYEQFYRRNGIWRLNQFLKPVIRLLDDIELPINSEYHNFVVSDVLEFIKKDSGIYKHMNKCVVESVLEYDGAHTSGNFRLLPGTPNDIITKFAKAEKKIRFIKYGVKYQAGDRMTIVQNYGGLTYRYKYLAQPLRNLLVYKNGINTAISKCLESNRNVFLAIELPNELMSRADLNRFSNKLSNGQSKLFLNYKYFNVLELWKYMNPDFREASVFDRIPKEKTKMINLVLIKDNKACILNLYKLNALVEENIKEKGYEKDSVIKPIRAQTALKLFYLFLFNVMTDDAEADVEADGLTVVKAPDAVTGMPTNTALTGKEDKEPTTVEIDSLIAKKVKEKDVDLKAVEEIEDTVVDDDDLEPEEEEDGISGLEYKETMDNDIDENLNTLDDVMKEDLHYDIVSKRAEILKESKLISKTVMDNAKETIEKQKKYPSPYGGKETIGEMLDESKDELALPEQEVEITDNVAVLDKTQNKNVINTINKRYITKQYKKDMLRSVYSLQNNKTVIEDYQIDRKESIMGKQEEHKIKIKTLGGNTSTISLVLPTIEENGTFTYNGNTYVKRASKVDLPLHKINPQRVCLTTYYSKVFVNKSYFSVDNLGKWLLNQVVARYDLGEVKDLVALPVKNRDVELPQVYNLFARFMKSFKVKDVIYYFEYETRAKMFSKISAKDLDMVEGKKYVIIGNDKGFPIVVDKDNNFFKFNSKMEYVPYPHLYQTLGLDLTNMPMENTTVSLYGTEVPVIIFLSYYLGLEKLLKMLNISYYKTEPGKRVEHSLQHMIVKFKDAKLVITKTNDYRDLIIAGLHLSAIEKITPQVALKTMNNRSDFAVMFTRMGLPLRYINEIKLMETMYVDPISKSVLKQMGEPTTFKGLLIRSCELLKDDNYTNPNSMDGMLARGYEDLPGLVYKELVDATRIYEGKSYFSKAKITVNPYSVLNKITEDSTIMLEDDLNPMASIKQTEDITATGVLGRSKATMNAETRKVTPNDIGIISEATRDSGDVGISAYFTAAPKLENVRGMVSKDTDKLAPANVFSSPAMLSPFSLTDDTKRLNFNSIMQSHIIPVNQMRAPYVLTGYESIVPIKASDKFAITALEEGKVISVTNKEIVVDYKNAGVKKYPLREWTTKELSEVCYTHKIVPNLKQGEKFIKDDTIAYDELFFEPSIFNPKRVIYKQGNTVTVALTEETMTDEDSAVVSPAVSDMFTTTVTKVKSIVINCKDNIVDLVQPGDAVEPTTPLFSIVDKSVNVAGLDAKAKEILAGIKNVSPKAKMKGVVSKIDIRYNCDPKECSKSIKDLIEAIDKISNRETGYSARVDSTYSIQGKPLMEGEVDIKIYIKVKDEMGLGDKGILSNQLKFTVGEVMDYDINGAEDNKPIDVLFSYRAVSARIVCSAGLIGTTSKLLEKIEEDAVNLYFN